MPLQLDPPRFETRDPFTAAGITLRGTADSDFGALWDALDERADEFEALAVSGECYGVVYDMDPETWEFTYLAGVPVDDDATDEVPADAETVAVHGDRFAVFDTTIEDVSETMDGIYGGWLPESEYERGDGPEFERYGADFDGAEEGAAFEVWIPVVEG